MQNILILLKRNYFAASTTSRRHKLSVLTANVNSRNLFKSIGFSRAAPDLMDSQICHGLRGQEGRKRAEKHQENMRKSC